MAKDSMVFYRSIADAVAELEPETYKTMMQSIFAYAYDGIYPEFDSKELRMAWSLVKQQVDACIRKYEAQVSNGQKGGRPRKLETQENPTKPKITQTNQTETLNEKCKMRNVFNDECIIARPRARESEDFDDGVWNPDEIITTTDGTQIRLGDVHFGGTVKVGMKRSGEPGTTILGHKVLTEEEKARMRNRADEFSVKYGGA